MKNLYISNYGVQALTKNAKTQNLSKFIGKNNGEHAHQK